MGFINGKEGAPIWVFPKEEPSLLAEIIHEFNIHPITAQVLITRGFHSKQAIHEFLYAKLPQLYDPDLFPEMDKAVQRVLSALEKQEAILVYGDNDVDGMSAAALLTEFLKEIGAEVYFNIPNRAALRQSLIGNALEFALDRRCSLLITVDCGITAAKEITQLIEHNIDVIVTDHHEPTAQIPYCIATLNPKLLNSTYPNRDLTGVGVAFKLAHALANILIEQGKIAPDSIDLKKYLDLVALGTVADMGALRGENRILVRYGLEEIRKQKRIGLKQLFEISETDPSSCTPLEITSRIAPRLNSLGRIAEPLKGVELLLIHSTNEAKELAQELDLFNSARQKIERKAAEDIEGIIFDHPSLLKEKAIVLYSAKWHSGIVAILSARLAKQYNRPTLILSIEEGIGKGSLRTIPEFPLLPVLKENASLLLNFGGHDYAAGLTLLEENIPIFKKRFIAAAKQQLKDLDLCPKLYLDAPMNFHDLTFDFMESLHLLEPFGSENPPPIFYCDAVQTWPPKVVGNYHLKFFLEQGGLALEGIGFGLKHRKEELMQKGLSLKIAFTPQINLFHNKASIQLQIKDFQTV